jgi:hypothetical protein
VITLGAGWQEILKKYDVRWAILRSQSPLARDLSASPGWATVYQDNTAIILIHR